MGLYYWNILFYGKILPNKPEVINSVAELSVKQIGSFFIQYKRLYETNDHNLNFDPDLSFENIIKYFLSQMTRTELLENLHMYNDCKNQWFLHKYTFSTDTDIEEVLSDSQPFIPVNYSTTFDNIVNNLLKQHDYLLNIAKINNIYNNKIYFYNNNFQISLPSFAREDNEPKEKLLKSIQGFNGALQELEDIVILL